MLTTIALGLRDEADPDRVAGILSYSACRICARRGAARTANTRTDATRRCATAAP
jgi:hypothetical protein